MNKLKVTIAGLLVACLGIGVSAQTSAPTAKQTPAKKSATKAKPATTKAKAADANATSTAKPAKHMKKDGTPDMRYKENKAAKSSTGAATPAAKKSTGTKKAAPKKATAAPAK